MPILAIIIGVFLIISGVESMLFLLIHAYWSENFKTIFLFVFPMALISIGMGIVAGARL